MACCPTSSHSSVWNNQDIKDTDYKKLHSFFWLFTIDLKSSKKITQSIILNWIETNQKYNSKKLGDRYFIKKDNILDF